MKWDFLRNCESDPRERGRHWEDHIRFSAVGGRDKCCAAKCGIVPSALNLDVTQPGIYSEHAHCEAWSFGKESNGQHGIGDCEGQGEDHEVTGITLLSHQVESLVGQN